MSEVRCPAVVLATRPLGDADLLVVMLTPDLGKVRAAARAARKSRKRFPGGLPGGALGEATLRPGRSGRSGLWRLDSFRSTQDLGGLGRDLDRFAYVAYVCEVSDVLIVEPEPDAERFAVLATAMTSILEDGPRPSVLRRFELRLLGTLGLLPSLDVCCICGGPVLAPGQLEGDGGGDGGGEQIPFDADRGGVLCTLHRAGSGADLALTPAVLRMAATLADATASDGALGELDAAPTATRRALRDLASGLVRAHLRRPLRSLQFLAQIGSAKATS